MENYFHLIQMRGFEPAIFSSGFEFFLNHLISLYLIENSFNESHGSKPEVYKIFSFTELFLDFPFH